MKKTIAIILVITLLFLGLISTGILNLSKKSPQMTPESMVIQEPKFKKEGELVFTKNKEKLTIEIADNDIETTQGLMYRRTMPDSCGMLFIFPDSEPRNFWMRNTYLPLDILFLDESKKIVTIQANRTPFSEEQIPSYQDAKYVLEVNAGYCKRKGVGKGDIIDFR